MEKQTKIRGYTVYLDTDADGSGSSYCHVSLGNQTASLALLEAVGEFDDGRQVPHTVIDAIAAWAARNGY